jgi:hypothetical protein
MEVSMSIIGWGIVMVIVLFAVLLVPFLYKEIRRGKADLGPRLPLGVGEPRIGTRANPAPGQPDGKPDPYSEKAQREAPPIKS